MSHSSGTPLALQSRLALVAGCRSRRTSQSVPLQSVLALVRDAVGVAVWLVAGRDVALVRNRRCVLQSWLVPVVMSQSSGTPLSLQSGSHSSGMPLLLQCLARAVDVALVRNAVGVAVWLARRDVAVVRHAVHVAVGLALVRDAVRVAVVARAGRDVALVRNAVAVAVLARARRDVAVVGNAVAVAVGLALVRDAVGVAVEARAAS